MPNDSFAPDRDDYEYRLVGWAKEAEEEADANLRSQKGYNKIGETIQAIMGDSTDMRVSNLSGVSANHVAKVALDLTAGMTDVKPFWEYKTTNKRNEGHANIYGTVAKHWWLQRMIDMKVADVVKYSLAGGTGWAEVKWSTETQDMDVEAWDPRDVLPIRPSTSLSIQDAYGVIARKSRTVNYVRYLCRSVYDCADKADLIKPDRDGSMVAQAVRNSRAGQLLAKYGNPFRERLFGSKPSLDIPKVPTCDVREMYIKDESVNKHDYDVEMGQFNKDGTPRNNWSYIVKPNEPLYPGKRMIVFTSQAILYDGPSIYWHGLFPFCKLTLDPWPWSWLGKGPLWDVIPLQLALDKHLRVYMDWLEKLARPDIVTDKNSVPKSVLDKWDTRRPGGKYQHNPISGKGVQIVPPPPLPPEFWKGTEFFLNEMNVLSGVSDVSQLMKLNQMPSADSIEQIMESMSPSVRLRSRVQEAFMREFALMTAFNISQFKTVAERITIMGPDGATMEDWDYDPDSLIPAFVHPEDFDSQGNVRTESLVRGPRPRYDRAKHFLKGFTFTIAPGSLLAASEIERKLMYLQLSRAGLLDHWTLMETLGIPNVGAPPDGVKTITERLLKEQELGMGMSVSPAGRKATGQTMPRLTTKES